MTALVLSVLGASLLGSAHCAAMCGGFVCFFGGQPGDRPGALPHVAYHGGRLLAYAMLGAAAGLAGAGFDLAGRMAGFQRPAAVVAGLLLVFWGLSGLLAAAGIGRTATAAPAGFRRLLARVVGALAGKPPVLRALAIGLLTALLPCGWLYLFVATAASTGAALDGALVMSVFWLGTVPVLAGVGALAQRAAGPFRRRLPVVTAAAMVVLGVLTVAGRFQPAPSSGVPAAHEHR